MFTGLVEDFGVLREIRPVAGGGVRLGIQPGSPITDLAVGESIAVNGVCLTVTAGSASLFQADVSPETLTRSTLGQVRPAQNLNLERALRLGDRLGGHFVSGHVDCQGVMAARSRQGNMEIFRFTLDHPSERFLVEKGSVAVDGISLTVSDLGKGFFEVAVIPHTLARTTLHALKSGAHVNLEMDLLGKYVERLLSGRQPRPPEEDRLGRDFLARHGFL